MSTTLLLLCFQIGEVLGQSEWSEVERIVAIGDLHGDYDQYITILQDNALVDKRLRWSAGKTHLVQLGDVADRGPHSLKIIYHLMKLQKQATKAGGKVHTLVGNHEAMNIKSDLRYVHPGEYKALITAKSRKLRKIYSQQIYKKMLLTTPELADKKQETLNSLRQKIPLGYVEHRQLWQPGGKIARWIQGNNTVIKLNNTLFVHGGLNPHLPFESLDKINATIQQELKRYASTDNELSFIPSGPLWYRGLATDSEKENFEALSKMLAFYKAKRIVIAHTPIVGAVTPRFNGKVILVDVGISKHYGARRASLVIEGLLSYSNHRGHQLPLPQSSEKILPYLLQVSQFDPSPSPLQPLIEKLSATTKLEAQ